MNYCFRCGKWKKLNPRTMMCAECVTMWLDATPAERRKLIRVVGP